MLDKLIRLLVPLLLVVIAFMLGMIGYQAGIIHKQSEQINRYREECGDRPDAPVPDPSPTTFYLTTQPVK